MLQKKKGSIKTPYRSRKIEFLYARLADTERLYGPVRFKSYTRTIASPTSSGELLKQTTITGGKEHIYSNNCAALHSV